MNYKSTQTPCELRPLAAENYRKNRAFSLKKPTPKTALESERLSIFGGEIETFSSSSNRSHQTQKVYTLNYIASGNGQLSVGSENALISTGSLFIIGPDKNYKIENLDEGPLLRYQISFNGSHIQRLLKQLNLSDSKPQNFSSYKWVKETFVSIQECGEDANTNASTACELLLEYLFTRLTNFKQIDETPTSASYSAYETSCNYIESFFHNINGAHQVAKACNISHQYLCYLFKRFSDETPTQMVLRLKLTRSAELLKKGNLLIKEIAQEVGFEDQYYFSKRFKNFFGVSPRYYVGREVERISA